MAQSSYPSTVPSNRIGVCRIGVSLAVLAIGALMALLTFHRLGVADVCGSNEAVEGVFLQQMVEHHVLLFPLENGQSPMYKPPLFHWTAAAIDRLTETHRVTAFNLRSTASLYAIAGALLTVYFACSFMGTLDAALAGLILCGSYQYIEQGRIGRVDMTLCFFETLALFAFAWWAVARSTPSRPGSMRYLFASALGLAVLAKGPVGAILPMAACGIFMVAERRLADLRALATPGPILVALVIGSSWYAACLYGNRYAFLHRQIGSENFGRFFGALGAMAPWYYVKPILLNSAPLSLIVPCAVYFALEPYWKASLSPIGHSDPSDPTPAKPALASIDRATVCVRLFAIFWIVTTVFFSVAAYKRRAYLLPLWPASAVLLAWWLGTLARRSYSGRLVRVAVALVCAGLIVFNFFYFPLKEVRDCGGDSYRQTAAQITRVVGADEPLYSFGFGDEPATLLFYLDRDAPAIQGKLGDAPPGYVIVPATVWARYKDEALDLEPVFESSSGAEKLLLLRHGKVYAAW
jgi:4-amino-4-deoxy-L-arabinose transferase-like glycosyltransferase